MPLRGASTTPARGLRCHADAPKHRTAAGVLLEGRTFHGGRWHVITCCSSPRATASRPHVSARCSRSSCCSIVCAWVWRVVDTRACTATRIRHLLGDRRQAWPIALPGPAHHQLIGLIPPALAIAARDGLAADGPRPDHRALLPGQHRYGEQIPANAV